MRRPFAILAFAVAAGVTGCGQPSPSSAQDATSVTGDANAATSASTRRAIQTYFDGLNAKDISRVPFAPDVVFTTPMISEPVRGEPAVRRFVESTLPGFTGATIERHIVDGEHAFTLFDIDWPQRGGSIKSSDYFHVVDGRIKEIRVYFDPRPIVGGGQFQGPQR